MATSVFVNIPIYISTIFLLFFFIIIHVIATMLVSLDQHTSTNNLSTFIKKNRNDDIIL